MPPGRRAPEGERGEKRRRGPAALSAVTAGEAGVRHLADLTGAEAASATRVEPAEDGWVVDVEVVEDRRIPSSGDILALYETRLDADGNLLAYRRKRRYRRASADGDADWT